MFNLFVSLEKYNEEKETIKNDLNINNMSNEQKAFYKDLI